MHIELITKEQAKPVLVELYDRAIDDRCPKDPEEGIALMPDEFYQGGYIDDKLAAVNFFHSFRDGIKIHFQVSKDFRRYSRQLLESSLVLLKAPFYAEIPVIYPEVINFARRHGFREVSVSPNILINNQWIERMVLRRD